MQSFRGPIYIVRATVMVAALFMALAVCAAPAYAAQDNEAVPAPLDADASDKAQNSPASQTTSGKTQDQAQSADSAEAKSDAALDAADQEPSAEEDGAHAAVVEGEGPHSATAGDGQVDGDAPSKAEVAEQEKPDTAQQADADDAEATDNPPSMTIEQVADRDIAICAIPGSCDKKDKEDASTDGKSDAQANSKAEVNGYDATDANTKDAPEAVDELAEVRAQAPAAASAPKAAAAPAKTVQVASGAWDALALEMKASGNTLGSLIELAPKLTGNASDLAFRYIIETANGKDVTVMRRYKRGIPDYSFKLNRSGNVTIKLVVSDYQGKTKELKRTLNVPTPAWDMKGMKADYQDGGATVFVPGLTGDTSYLRYTYTWTAADGSQRTGTLKPNGDMSQAWKPADGTYDVALHVVGTDGKVRDAALTYVQGAKRASYTYQVSTDSPKVGSKVHFQAQGTDEDGKQLKFRYSLVDVNGKAKVFRAASAEKSATLTAPAPGGYFTVHVDALLGNGSKATRIDPMTVWNYQSLVAAKNRRNVTVTANMMALPPGFTYHFTRSGSTGGVMFSKGASNVAKFTAPANGTYEISCAVFDKNGKQVGIRTTTIKVVPPIQEAMDNMVQRFASATNKMILVNTRDKYVGIYQGSRGNWNNIHFNRISVGKPSSPTVKGEYTVGGKGYSFSGPSYTCYYWTQIWGAYLFHSVKYKLGSHVISDGRLGMEISAGCVRMDINDAKWLQQNVPGGSKIYIY